MQEIRVIHRSQKISSRRGGYSPYNPFNIKFGKGICEDNLEYDKSHDMKNRKGE